MRVKVFKTIGGSLAMRVGRYQLTCFPMVTCLIGDLKFVEKGRKRDYAKSFIAANWRMFLLPVTFDNMEGLQRGGEI